jgi:tripartite-type tricarboxylate transporter receptor subunit TctC
MLATGAAAQSYSTKPIRIIAPFTSGGPVDISARILAQELNETWGQQIVVENRAGAGGTRWVTEVGRIVSLPKVKKRIIDLGGEPVSGTPAQLDAFQKSEAVRWAKVIRESGATAQ